MSWKDSPNIYPPPEEIVEALQDCGKKEKATKKGREYERQRFLAIEKLARKIYNAIREEFKNPEGLTKNVSRGAQGLYKEIVLLRKHADVTETDAFYHQYGKEGKVYLIANSPSRSGLDIAVNNFQLAIESSVQQKNTARTCNDGLRVACLLLDSKYRQSVSGIMTKKKNRSKSDITGDHVLNFFEVIKEDFSSPNYIASFPNDKYYSNFPEDEKGGWDPNNASVFEHERSPEWLKETWECYVRPKYKKALDKWNKDTGGGDGTPESFIDFCAGDRWLVFIFCMDHDANFLLAGNAGGRMPAHLQFESGFSDHSSLTGSEEHTGSKRSAAEVELSVAKKTREDVRETLDCVRKYLNGKQEDATDSNLRKVANYSSMMVDNAVLDTMSPESKRVYVDSLKKKRKDVLDRLNST